MLSEDEASLLYRCIAYARENCESLTCEQDQQLDGLLEKLFQLVYLYIFCFLYSLGSFPIYRLNVFAKNDKLSKPQSEAVSATLYPSDK